MSDETTDRRMRKMSQIKGLLDLANNNPFGEEAAAARAKAEHLMELYRVGEWEIAKMEGKGPRTEPILREIIVIRERGNQVKAYMIDMFAIMCMFSHCRSVYWGLEGDGPCTARVVGYPEDIEYLDMLFTSVALQFSQELNPHVEPGLSRAENVYRMKAAGLQWEEIFKRLDLPYKNMDGSRTPERGEVYGEYQRFCLKTGLKPISANPKMWVRNFAEGYVARIQERVIEIQVQRKIQQENEAEKIGNKYELVLRDRDKMVGDKFREFFPSIRYGKAFVHKGKSLADAVAQGSAAGSKADIGEGGSIRNTRKELGS